MIPPAAYVAAAQASMRRWGRPASIALGQAQLESRFGLHMPARSNNPLGIKDYRPGAGTVAITGENRPDGTAYRTRLPFRIFGSIADAFDFHGRLLATDARYAAARAALPDLQHYVERMAKVYATGPAYGGLLWKIIQSGRLDRFDRLPPL